MSNLLKQSQMFLKRNSSTILTCVGAIGVITTSVLAVKATPKAMENLKQAKEEKGEELTKLEVVKVAAPAYIPAALSGIATITCVFGANTLNKRQQASLISAYALLDNSYKEYREKTEELYGEGASRQIKDEIAKDNYKEADIDQDEYDDSMLFYDEFSDRYFTSTIEDVQRAEYRLNRDLVMRDYAYLNEFYEELGLEPIDAGYTLGWSRGGNLDRYWQEWIDFSHRKVDLEDGMECRIITMFAEPYPDFEDYF